MKVYEFNGTRQKRHFRQWMIGLIVAVSAIILALAGIEIYLNIIQLDEIGGYSGIYLTNLFAEAAMFVGAFIVIFIVTWLTNIVARRNLSNIQNISSDLSSLRIPNKLIALVFGIVGGLSASGSLSRQLLFFLNYTPFDNVDPIFGQNTGYYIFQRPFLMNLFGMLTNLAVVIIFYTIAYYAVHFLFLFHSFHINDLKERNIAIHNIVNVLIYFILKVASIKFTKEDILFSRLGNVNGAGFVEVNVLLPFYNILPFLILAIVAAAIYFLFKGRIRAAVIAVAVYPALWILVGGIASFVQGVIVSPNEYLKEKTYLKYDIEETRKAYNLDKIAETDFEVDQQLNSEIIANHADVIENIRVTDYEANLRSDNQLQSIRSFFRFHEGDILNYKVNGKEIPVFIVAREMNKDRLTDATYVNTKFKYTHGYGLVMNPINRYTAEGQVDFILKDMPVSSTDPDIVVTQPRIYYGELTNDYVFVNARGTNEIDGDESEYRYTGSGGITLGRLKRLLFAIKYSDINMLISQYIQPETSILINRNIYERAKMAAPFLRIDPDAYLIVTDDGRLLWVLDAYTTSAYYPYSQIYENYNYIRNSVKITVDAYNGTTRFYLIDPADPIAVTLGRIYPQLFAKEDLPDDVREHMKYPEYLFRVQAEMMKRYHLDPRYEKNVEAFYNNQEVWDIAKYNTGKNQSGKEEIEPYYSMLRLPGDKGNEQELILMLPFTFANKDTMISWMAVRCKFENYGELILYNFPPTKTVYGPNQVETQINQEPNLSRDISLWSQGGNHVFKGNLLVIPIEESLLYVQPIYIEANTGASIPQVRKIVVAHQVDNNLKITYGLTLEEALSSMFPGFRPGQKSTSGQPETAAEGSAAGPGTSTEGGTSGAGGTAPGASGAGGALSQEMQELINRAITTFEEANDYLKDNDWESFGRKMNEHYEILNQLRSKSSTGTE